MLCAKEQNTENETMYFPGNPGQGEVPVFKYWKFSWEIRKHSL